MAFLKSASAFWRLYAGVTLDVVDTAVTPLIAQKRVLRAPKYILSDSETMDNGTLFDALVSKKIKKSLVNKIFRHI